MRRIVTALCGAALLVSLGASTVFAGEITGTGRSLKVEDGGKWGTFLHARSECAYSGQEDDQYLDATGQPKPTTRGVPGHAQSWGQIPKSFRDLLTTWGYHPSQACNPIHAGSHP